jgi:hypothetical protein
VAEALGALVDALEDADARTYDVFARDFAWLGAEPFWYALDEVVKRQDPGYHGTPITETAAGYARGVLQSVAAGQSFPPEWRQGSR